MFFFVLLLHFYFADNNISSDATLITLFFDIFFSKDRKWLPGVIEASVVLVVPMRVG